MLDLDTRLAELQAEIAAGRVLTSEQSKVLDWVLQRRAAQPARPTQRYIGTDNPTEAQIAGADRALDELLKDWEAQRHP